MSPERDERIYAIFCEALRCDPAGRAALLDEMCASDPELRADVERLLAVDEFLESRDGFDRDASETRPASLWPGGFAVHVLCPHCSDPIELADLPDAYREVGCPSCGLTFRLEPGSTAFWGPREGPGPAASS
jgi:hypothetical protein